MLKGRDSTEVLNGLQAPLSAEEKSFFSPLQDTLHKTKNQNFSDSLINQDSIKPFTSQTLNEHGAFAGIQRSGVNIDLFTVITLFSLFALSWVKIVYQKFLVQIVAGLIDYQVAMRLYRERNVLYRNVSIGLHLIFYINLALFIYYLFDYYNINQIFDGILLNVLFYSLAILTVYSIKSLFSKILGYIFLVKENFAQYIHNVNLYNKNIGLFLFPIIILYPFTFDNSIKGVIIYSGIALLTGIFLLRSYRSTQIILKKGISLFYLILYLCAVEILPVLLMVKLLNTLIFNDN